MAGPGASTAGRAGAAGGGVQRGGGGNAAGRGGARPCAAAADEDPSSLEPCPILCPFSNSFEERAFPDKELPEVRCA